MNIYIFDTNIDKKFGFVVILVICHQRYLDIIVSSTTFSNSQ